MADDPLTQVYDFIWTTLEAESDFTDIVPVGNRIKLTAAKAVHYIAHRISKDFPVVTLEPDGGAFNFGTTSDRNQIDLTFALRAMTSEIAIKSTGSVVGLHDLKWIIFKALGAAIDGRGFTADELGADFALVQLRLQDGADESQGDENDPRHWQTVLRIGASLLVKRTAMGES